jgi:hypothetical protein
VIALVHAKHLERRPVRVGAAEGGTAMRHGEQAT